ncbi:MAG: nuclear transport factor 2 family protein [Candidatus Binataceae bacterium]
MAAKTVEQMVTEVADRQAIGELPKRYCDYVWRGDVEGLVNLFAEDGSFVVVGNKQTNTTTGRAALRKSYADGLAALTPRPYIHNHVIDLQGGGRANGRAYVELRDASHNMSWLGTGYYEDEYVKAGDDWKFQSRKFHRVHMEERPKK